MINKEKPTPTSLSAMLDLRQRAEAIAQVKEARSSAAPKVVSPAETQKNLHELLVHQIELEMQNDELRRAQIELEKARARYLDLYDTAPVGYCIISDKGIITDVNLTAADLLGATRGVLVMKQLSRFIVKEDQDIYYLHKLKLFETEQQQVFELRMKKKAGNVFWANFTATALQDADGKQISRVIFSDITERKLEEEYLKSIKDRLSAEIEAMNRLHIINTQFIRQNDMQSTYKEILKSAMEISNADKGMIQILDEEEFTLKIFSHYGFGKSFLKDFENVTYNKGFFGKVIQEKKRIIIEDITRKSIFFETLDLQLMFAEGIESMQSTPLVSSSGNILGILSTHYQTRHSFNERELRMFDLLASQAADILDRARIGMALQQGEQRAIALVEELRKADRDKDEFMAMLSHELRNPLAAALAGMNLIKLAKEEKQIVRGVDIMTRQLNQLRRHVDDLLDITRIRQHKDKLKKEYININEIAYQTAEDIKPQFIDKGVQLDTEIPADATFMLADPVRLAQIVGNLLYNSMKFTPKGGITSLKIYKDKNEVVINVTDNGIGIEPELVHEIFKPFTQARNSLDRSYGGIGLGLAIVQNLVELHGGSVSAHSKGLGKGALFTVRLPLSPENYMLTEGTL